MVINLDHYCFNFISLCVEKLNSFHLYFGHYISLPSFLSPFLFPSFNLSLTQFDLSEIGHKFQLAAALALQIRKKKKKVHWTVINTMRTEMWTVFLPAINLHNAWL